MRFLILYGAFLTIFEKYLVFSQTNAIFNSLRGILGLFLRKLSILIISNTILEKLYENFESDWWERKKEWKNERTKNKENQKAK